MVLAILMHTIDPGPCRILYRQVYGSWIHCPGITPDVDTTPKTDDAEGKLHKVAFRVQSEYAFRKAGSLVKQQDETTTERMLLSVESGVFRCTPANPFEEECHVVWQGLANCGFSFVLSPMENKALAENVLSLLVRYILQACEPMGKPEQILLQPEKIAAILDVFLPMGQLVFMNHRVLRQLEKNLFKLIFDKR